MKKLLVIDSDIDLCNTVSALLRNNGFEVFQAFTGTEARNRFQAIRPGIILMERILPDMHGDILCREFKRQLHTGVIYLTAQRGKNHQLQGFQSGADDYVIKPFDFDILLARIHSLHQKLDLIAQSIHLNGFHLSESLHFDMLKRDVIYEGQHLELTPTEFKILYFLAQKNSFVNPLELLSHIYKVEQSNIDQSRTVSVHMASIRRKLQKVTKDRIVILSKYKKGYKLLMKHDGS